jgi:hypothetical protein
MLGWRELKTNPSKTGVQRALHCRCGREKILALGLCATCYTLKRQDDEYLVGCESRSWSEMASAAVFAELRGDANAPSWFIIAYQENPYSIL